MVKKLPEDSGEVPVYCKECGDKVGTMKGGDPKNVTCVGCTVKASLKAKRDNIGIWEKTDLKAQAENV